MLCCAIATTDQHEYVPQDAVQALAAGWRDNPNTRLYCGRDTRVALLGVVNSGHLRCA